MLCAAGVRLPGDYSFVLRLPPDQAITQTLEQIDAL
jgi:hypothetical protein